MAQHTPIEYVDSAVNPVMGCDGCELWIPGKVEHCYAGTLHKLRGGQKGYARRFEEPETFPGRMAKAAAWLDLRGVDRPDKPWLNGRPRHIFISDMGDALSKDVPLSFLADEVVGTVRGETWQGRGHIGMWLTKQPQRMATLAEYIQITHGWTWPDALWAGTSITSREQMARVRHLQRVPARVRFLSCEPLLSDLGTLDLSGIHLVIVGGESGPGARPCDLNWIRRIVRQCQQAQVPAFVKQLGAKPYEQINQGRIGDDGDGDWDYGWLKLRDRKGGAMDEFPEDLRIRQWPEVTP